MNVKGNTIVVRISEIPFSFPSPPLLPLLPISPSNLSARRWRRLFPPFPFSFPHTPSSHFTCSSGRPIPARGNKMGGGRETPSEAKVFLSLSLFRGVMKAPFLPFFFPPFFFSTHPYSSRPIVSITGRCLPPPPPRMIKKSYFLFPFFIFPFSHFLFNRVIY